MDCLSDHFKMKKNKCAYGSTGIYCNEAERVETINNFITRLQKLPEHCGYDEDRDNQVRDHMRSLTLKIGT